MKAFVILVFSLRAARLTGSRGRHVMKGAIWSGVR